jgi:hypothetical protein
MRGVPGISKNEVITLRHPSTQLDRVEQKRNDAVT